jgi:hypothetical protein
MPGVYCPSRYSARRYCQISHLESPPAQDSSRPLSFHSCFLMYRTAAEAVATELVFDHSGILRARYLIACAHILTLRIPFRTAAEPVATELVFDHSGRLARSKKVARAVGTTVAVAKLFSPLPVRYREFTRNVKREYGKLLTLLQVGALVWSVRVFLLVPTNSSDWWAQQQSVASCPPPSRCTTASSPTTSSGSTGSCSLCYR